MKSKSLVLKSAVIILISNLIVKVISGGFKIPLVWLIGSEGMGLFSAAFNIYIFAYMQSCAGFPVAISKLVAECEAKNNPHEAKRVFNVALFILVILGLFFSSMTYFFAKPLANDFLKNSKAYIPLISIAPAILFVTIGSAFKGYFQGKQNMYPTAVSNILDSLGKLVFGCILSFVLYHYGFEYASGGASLGVSIGTFLGFLLLLIIYIKNYKKTAYKAGTKRYFRIAKELLVIAVPITISACVSSLISLVDTFVITNRLQASGLMGEQQANQLFGYYSGYAGTLFRVPFIITVGLSTAIVPSISKHLAKGNRKRAIAVARLALLLSLAFTLFCACVYHFFAYPMLKILFSSATPLSGELLSRLAPAIVFLGLFNVMQAILQAYGKVILPIFFILVGVVVNFVIQWYALPTGGIIYASIASSVCYGVIFLLTFLYMVRITRVI